MARLHVRRGMPLKDVDELKARQMRAQQQQQQSPYGGRESQERYANNGSMRCYHHLSCWKSQVALTDCTCHKQERRESRLQQSSRPQGD